MTNVYAFPSGAELWLVDLSDEKNPALLSDYVASFGIEIFGGLAVQGNFAYLSSGFKGMEIVDISNPRKPFRAGLYASLNTGRCVTVQGDTAFLASFTPPGLSILDVHDRSHPVKLKDLALPSNAMGMVIQSNLLLVADFNAGLQVIDVANSLEPALNVSRHGAAGFVELNGTLNTNYILESTDSFSPGHQWTELFGTTLTNHPQTVLRLSTNGPAGFYRVRSR